VDFVMERTVSKKPRVALVAHDHSKPALLSLARDHESTLKELDLVATQHTGELLARHTGLTPVRLVASGPLGGDLVIASEIVKGRIHALIFLCDTTQTHPHQNDIDALLRVATLYNIPLATNPVTAALVLSSGILQPDNRLEKRRRIREASSLH